MSDLLRSRGCRLAVFVHSRSAPVPPGFAVSAAKPLPDQQAKNLEASSEALGNIAEVL